MTVIELDISPKTARGTVAAPTATVPAGEVVGIVVAQGAPGVDGAPGPAGGPKGDKGDPGADSTVPGPKGDTGDTGPPGSTTIEGIAGLQTSLDGRELIANKGAVNGYAPLDANQLIPAVYLPSYVDDVLEFANVAGFPGSGVAGTIYVALDSNKTYRWGGSAYVEISSSPGSTDAVPEGSANLYYTSARADGRVAAAVGITVQPWDATTTSYTAAEKAKLAGISGTNTGDQDLSGKLDTSAAPELIRDTIGAALVAGSNVTITPNDAGDTITITSTAAGGGGDVTLTGTQTISAKTIGDDLKFTAITAPAAPATGTIKLYSRTGVSGIDAMAYVNSIGVPVVLGRDVAFFAKNTSGATIVKGSVVYVSSASASTLFISKAQADSGMTKLPAVGVVTADIANNTYGMVLQAGLIQAVDTSAMGDGATIYVSSTVAGAFTATAPSHPAVEQAIGLVVNANVSGSILVTCCNAINLHRIDGVNGNSFAIGDGTGSGAKTFLFKNTNTGTLTWTPTTARTITLPDATGTVLTSGAAVTIPQGGTGVATLPTGLLKGAGTGAITAATAGTDYLTPTGSAATLTGFPTLNQNTTGSAATLTTARTVNGVSFNGSANIVLTPRIGTTASSATPSIDCGLYDQYNITALAANITSVTITGTPVDGQKLLVRITGTATRTIAWGSSFQSSGAATLLATTSGTNTHLVGLIYDSVKAKFVCQAVDAIGY